jgi:hypothetical protein
MLVLAIFAAVCCFCSMCLMIAKCIELADLAERQERQIRRLKHELEVCRAPMLSVPEWASTNGSEARPHLWRVK